MRRRHLNPGSARGAPTPLNADDLALFRAAVADAAPLRTIERVPPLPPSIPPIAIQALLDEREVLLELAHVRITPELALETGEEARFVAPGIATQVLRKLRRGQWVVQDELDLHGATREEARVLLALFLRDCLRRSRRCVRIIHGKGLGSKNREPVLKGKVVVWLAQREEVVAFCQAPPTQGGGGALLVLLRG